MAHLIKKNPKFVDAGFLSKRAGPSHFCETRINAAPSGHRMKEGDIIYVAETGYAIYAKGRIAKVNGLVTIHNLEQLFEYYQRTNIQNAKYWFQIANEKIFKQRDLKALYVFEYEAELSPVDTPIYLPPQFRGQSSYYEIEDNYKFPEGARNFELSTNIPTSLRFFLFNKWNVGLEKLMIDIDHFVPSSLGGPGNIEENLELVGLTINRKKSNSVPRGLYVRGVNFCRERGMDISRLRKFTTSSSFFEESAEGKDVAKEIIATVNSKENSLDFIRSFYASVKSYHRDGPLRDSSVLTGQHQTESGDDSPCAMVG